MKRAWDFDVIVVGGGPAGSTAARALALRGRRTLLLERERHPRFHIGESLLPLSGEVFRALGLDDAVRGLGLVEKWGAVFVTPDGATERYAEFAACPEVREPRTWQVLRSRFDEFLLRQAAAAGADVREEHRALDARFDDDGVDLELEDASGTRRSVRAGALVDASGRFGFLAKSMGLRRPDAALRKVAVFAHYEGVPREAGRRAGDIRILTREDLGWFWVIPLDAERTSVGAVLDAAHHASHPGLSPEERLEQCIAETPAAAALMRNARRAGPVRAEADFSYGTTRYAGDRWLLAGDAGSFLDPVFSTGVQIALRSGLEAAGALDRALARGRFRARDFRGYEREQRRRYRHFRRLVRAFYRPEFRDLFFRPEAAPRMFRAVTTLLAGLERPRLATRLLWRLFFALVRLQRFFPLVPRLAAAAPPPPVPCSTTPRPAPGSSD
jgi:flavin-dependent dehydrogenase